MIARLTAGLIAAGAAVSGAHAQDAETEATLLDVAPETRDAARAYMNAVLEGAAGAVWAVDPSDPEAWPAARAAAEALGAEGEALKTADFSYDPNADVWTGYSQQVVDAAAAAMSAIEAEDVDAYYAAGDLVYSSCENCHLHYAEVAPPPVD